MCVWTQGVYGRIFFLELPQVWKPQMIKTYDTCSFENNNELENQGILFSETNISHLFLWEWHQMTIDAFHFPALPNNFPGIGRAVVG